jgi:hypothetical protein
MHMAVADIVVRAMHSLEMRYPLVSEQERSQFDAMRKILEAEK